MRASNADRHNEQHLNGDQFRDVAMSRLAAIPDSPAYAPERGRIIDTKDVGFHVHTWESRAGRAYDSSIERQHAKEDLGIEPHLETISLQHLHTIQEGVHRSGVEGYIDRYAAGGEEEPPRPNVTRTGGRLWIEGGHHRLAAQKLGGRRTAQAYIMDADF